MAQHGRGVGSATPTWAWGGVIGPAVFVADWALLGATRPGYSAVQDAISRLAEQHTSTRPAMTGGFVVYGLGLLGYAVALRASPLGPAWRYAAATGLTTLGVAAFPLGTPTAGRIHAVVAAAGYATLAGVPLAASGRLAARGQRRLARWSLAAGLASGASLLASAVGAPAHGLTQRVGLTIGDTWVVLSALQILREGPGRGRQGPSTAGSG